ncbi:hypothetical protein LX36DRAFT_149850 [Colletotrichum falcatum]|nr:hypothetical protein LX36DRAFT_149850 [Colletotrichum falcatum]
MRPGSTRHNKATAMYLGSYLGTGLHASSTHLLHAVSRQADEIREINIWEDAIESAGREGRLSGRVSLSQSLLARIPAEIYQQVGLGDSSIWGGVWTC